MPELSNSHRRLYKATYAPIRPARRVPGGRAFAKGAWLDALSVSDDELRALRRRPELATGAVGTLLEVAAALPAGGSSLARRRAVARLRAVSEDDLRRVGEAVVQHRRQAVAEMEAALVTAREDLRASRAQGTAPERGPEAPRGPEPERGSPEADLRTAAPLPRIEDTVRWAMAEKPGAVARLRAATADSARAPILYSNSPPERLMALTLARSRAALLAAERLVDSFDEEMKVEPIGRLHLERMEMTPVGVERGELVSSIPLAPLETVNISHREWSLTTEEYESIIVDQFEGYSEKGVSEKTDVAQSVQSERQQASAISVAAAASASYMGVTVSSSLGYNSSSGDSQAQEDSRNHTLASTRKASARVRKDHKTSFRVSSVAGTEDRSVRVITNPSPTESLRVDYYQLMRKWRVDLYRYGLRMTYDIVIPSPGADLLRRYRQLEALDAEISTPFSFDLQPGQVTRDNWQTWAAAYQAEVEPPPPAVIKKLATATIQSTHEEATMNFAGTIDLEVDDGYYLSYLMVLDEGHTEAGGEDSMYDINAKLYMVGRTGLIRVPFRHRAILVANITAQYDIALTDDAWRAWQFRAWAKIRAAAEDRHLRERQQLKDARAELESKIAPFDALTLRRMELEEIEKGVLRWLFGPDFDVAPADVAAILDKLSANDPLGNDARDPSSLTNQQWQRVLTFGEFVKFLHHAIEWENLLYFTYPYFWDTPQDWTLKRFLEHPDAFHRRFLRAGSARVVLTIRPGFEKSFAELVETGGFDQLPGDHPYVSVAEEIQNYAQTNYPGIPPANPENPPTEEEVNAAERGQLQATWWEYTPTSALDIQLNTALAQMA